MANIKYKIDAQIIDTCCADTLLFSKKMDHLVFSIKENGGKAMLIGGAVIDAILQVPIKDWDIEVYRLTFSQIENILISLGLTSNPVGKSFGVIKTQIEGVDIDISIPRRENKVGVGHRGFDIQLDHTMTPKEAGLRRDLTINSMYLDLETNTIVDSYGGLIDLELGILRATNPQTFVEDPLRVLRIMQLLSRKGRCVNSETIELCRSIVDEFETLPKERVFEEFNKLLMKSSQPSMGLEFLRECGWLKHFPELFDLIGCEQNPDWHPEGDVWDHTMMVIDNSAQLRKNVEPEYQLAYMYAALLHDIGKPATTDLELKSYGHDACGEKLARVFMCRITSDHNLIENVCKLVGLHMRPGQLHHSSASIPAWRRLHNSFRLDVLGWLCKADSAGRTNRSINDDHQPSKLCFEYFKEFGSGKIAPIVQGRDLIELGLQPSKEFKTILTTAYDLQMTDYSKEEILEWIKKFNQKQLSM
jgi:tRNA nucleotidyltransferase (CCA-adding enzyme)